MVGKFKRYWKHIIIMVVFGYFGITVITAAFGYDFIRKQKKAIENHETEIGSEFSKRKEDFHERFYKNWDEGLNSLKEHFARSEKRSDQGQIKGMKRALKSMIERKVNLDEIEEDQFYLAMAEKAFEKKWSPKRENETDSQYKRRVAEGCFDWGQVNLERREIIERKTDSEFVKDWVAVDIARELFANTKEEFFSNYDDEYRGILETDSR